jgi:hypothetical protein
MEQELALAGWLDDIMNETREVRMHGARVKHAPQPSPDVSVRQAFGVAKLHDFQLQAAESMARERSRTFLNVSTGGGKTLALLFDVIRAAKTARATQQPFPFSLCFTPLLALQADHVAKLCANKHLAEFVEVFSLADAAAEKRLLALLGSKEPIRKAVLVFLNPEKYEVHKSCFIEAANDVSHLLFDEVHTYVTWQDFRRSFASLSGIARDFQRAAVACATATLAKKELDLFSNAIGVQSEEWRIVQHFTRRENHYYHVIEERVVLGHVGTLFAKNRLPLLVIVNSIAALHALHARIVQWSGLPPSSVLLYAAGFSDEHKAAADARFRDRLQRDVIMIATTAYALGIDAYITSVIQFGVPSTVTAFVQGAGRAGRDPSITAAHCTLIVDAVGLRGADEGMKRLLGLMRAKPKKPKGSEHQAQCTLCLKWCALPHGAALPKDDDEFFCEQAGTLCANVSRFPVCVHVMTARFQKGDTGPIDRALEEGELVCQNRCDCCVRPPIPDPPAVGQFVRVVSATSVNYQRVGKVVGKSEDLVRVLVDFGGLDSEVSVPREIVTITTGTVNLPDRIVPVSAFKPQVLRRGLLAFFESFPTDLPQGLLVQENVLGLLVEGRPETTADVQRVCSGVHPDCAEGVARLIAAHNRQGVGSARTGKKAKPGKKANGRAARVQSDSDGDDYNENGMLAQLNFQFVSSRGRALKKSKKTCN